MQVQSLEHSSHTVNRQLSATQATVRLSNPAKILRGYMQATGETDSKAIASNLGISLRTVQRLKLEIACATDGAANDAKCAISGATENANSAMDGVSGGANDAISGVSQKEKSPHTPLKEKYNNITTLSTSSSRASEGAAAAAARIDYDDLEKQLVGACNGSLADPVNAQGLLDLSTPIAWLRNGCDLEADVLPVLRAIGRRDHGKRIGHWGYFTKAVAEAKDRRVRGLPAVAEPNTAQPSAVSKRDQYAIAYDRALAERKARREAAGGAA